MKVLVTGAHFTPAVAVIKKLQKMDEVKIVYVGRKTTLEGDSTVSVESKILPKLGVKFIPLIAGRIQRKFTIYTISSILKIPIGFIQSFFILLFEKPDIILSFGGYVSVPLVILGWLFSIPVILHEQTIVSGLANKISAFFADKIFFGFADNAFSKNPKAYLIGNPIREEILNPKAELGSDLKQFFAKAKKEKLPVVYITGGNQGSHIINLEVEKIISKLTNICFVIHQSGDSSFNDFERLNALGNFNNRYIVKKWIDEEIGIVLSKSDLIISRAGANTLTEAAFLSKPVLVIPLPHIYQDEQNKNAKYFERLGLVTILPQSRLSENFYSTLKSMLNNLSNLKTNALEAKKIVIPDVAQKVALEVILLGKKGLN